MTHIGLPELIVLSPFLLLCGFYMYCYWRIFEKAGKPGWAGIVPIYNMIVILKIIGKPLWWIALLIIPYFFYFITNDIWIKVFFSLFALAIMIMISIELAKVFGKTTGFGVGLALLSFIFIPILAFGDAQYVGAPAQQ